MPTQVRILLPPLARRRPLCPGALGATGRVRRRGRCVASERVGERPLGRPERELAPRALIRCDVRISTLGVIRGSQSAIASKTITAHAVVRARVGARDPAELDLDGKSLANPRVEPRPRPTRRGRRTRRGWSDAPCGSNPRRSSHTRPRASRGMTAASNFEVVVGAIAATRARDRPLEGDSIPPRAEASLLERRVEAHAGDLTVGGS